MVSQKDWDLVNLQLMSMINFVKFVHGFLSLPFFLLLVVPVLRNVVLHTWPTGYDRRGRCRRYIGPQKPTPKDDGREIPVKTQLTKANRPFRLLAFPFWFKHRYAKWNHGKWKHGLKPAVVWWFNFDPYPYFAKRPTFYGPLGT